VIFKIDPLQDPRWLELVERHAFSSIFHTRGWLEALRRTYGFKLTAYTSAAPGSDLNNGLAFCRVRGFFSSPGLVSLPYSDHCEPLCESPEELDFLMGCVQAEMEHRNWKYLEMRPRRWTLNRREDKAGFRPLKAYILRSFELGANLDELFARLDDSLQRRIRSAQQTGLTVECGRSEELLKSFYRLMMLSEKRRSLPLNPAAWFRNLVDCLGESVEIRVASRGKIPVAASMSLRFRDKVLRKYSCSDTGRDHSDAASALLWNELVDAKSKGVREYELGRIESRRPCSPDCGNEWNSGKMELVSWRYPAPHFAFLDENGIPSTGNSLFASLTQPLLKAAARVMYPHLG